MGLRRGEERYGRGSDCKNGTSAVTPVNPVTGDATSGASCSSRDTVGNGCAASSELRGDVEKVGFFWKSCRDSSQPCA